MPELIKQPDGSVRWDYDIEPEAEPKRRAPKKTAAPVVTDDTEES